MADSLIRRQKALKFFVVANNKRTGIRNGIVLRQSEDPVRPHDQTSVSLRGRWRTQPSRRNFGTWLKRLQGMVRLEKLAVFFKGFPCGSDPDLANPLKSLINAVIMRNASTLIRVCMECNSLPVYHKPGHPVLVYGKLQGLSCEYLTPAAAAACPRLVHLIVSLPVSAEVMQNLPHGTMQHLYVDPDTQEAEEVEAFVTAVSRMTQLKEIRWVHMDCDTSLINPDPLYTKLFNNMKQLEMIEVGFPSEMDGTVDAAIDRLVDNNPLLTHIDFNNASVTGASLVTLSRLTGVQVLSLRHFGTNKPEFTTDDILILLRGGSREVLQYLRLDMRSRPDQGRIEAEAKIMEQEMGCPFSVVFGGFRTLTWVCVTREAKAKEAAYEGDEEDVIDDNDEELEDAHHRYG